jgi:hypothetical protein
MSRSVDWSVIECQVTVGAAWFRGRRFSLARSLARDLKIDP